MSLQALDFESTVSYVCPLDPCYSADGAHKKGATVFKLRALDTVIMSKLQDDAINSGGFNAQKGIVRPAGLAVDICRYGIAGWEGFLDKDGNEVECKKVKEIVMGVAYYPVDINLIRTFPMMVLNMIGGELDKLQKVSSDDLGKSKGQ